MRVTYDLVELYGDGDAIGLVVAVARAEADLAPAAMAAVASALGLPRTVFVTAARREDCEARARIFTPTRELPRAAEATLALAVLAGRAVAVEEGVTRADAWPEPDGSFRTAAPPPVLGPKDVEDRALAASAVGLDAGDLDPGLPVRAASCGPNVLILPARDEAALRRARLAPDAWRRTIEKARHLGALVLCAPSEGDPARARCLAPDAEELGNGLAACAAANYLASNQRGPAMRAGRGSLPFVFDGDPNRRARLTVVLPSEGVRDFVVAGVGRRVGGGAFER